MLVNPYNQRESLIVGKATGRHQAHKLNDRMIQSLGPGVYCDGGCLQLVIDGDAPPWCRRWVANPTVKVRNGRGYRVSCGLGSYPVTSLKMARELAIDCHRQARAGINPVRARRDALPESAPRFEQIARDLHADLSPGWSEKHAREWVKSLETYVFPRIGRKAVNAITVEDVLGCLRPVWSARNVTATRIRDRLEVILDRAAALGHRQGDNPARWRAHLQHMLARPSKVHRVTHLAAMDFRAVPAFMAELVERDGISVKALMFAILTAARPGEVRYAKWVQINLKDGTWIIPADAMKSSREHRVPLVAAAVKLLGVPRKGDALIFPDEDGQPLHDKALPNVLRQMGYDKSMASAHGFRSAFKDWCRESTNHSRETVEAALAHQLGDKTELAYGRGDMLAKRRVLMKDWADFCMQGPVSDNVVQLRTAAE